jgi:RNA polymerase sigma-70 factor, ECF subfamily
VGSDRVRQTELAGRYEAARQRLIRLAYAVLGSHAEAEDVVADCWLLLSRTDAVEPVRDVNGWATVAVARRALDVLASARVRRESYVGPWLPEPVLGDPQASPDPADRVTLDDTVSFALLVVLERLTPAERTAWVLHDLFAMPFEEVGAVLGRSAAAVRQLAVRARRHVADAAPRLDVPAQELTATVAAFTAAAAGGNLAELVALLDPAVVLTGDGGGEVTAARRPVVGADKVARFLIGIASRPTPGQSIRPAVVNGSPGLLLLAGERVRVVVSLTARNGLITRVDMVLAPAKLPRTSG